MKVCTDACLFSAWIATKIKDHKIESVLDIGAGTGLLSLMIAQVSTAQVEAVEIDENAYQQAVENFRLSPWNDRLKAHHSDINMFHASVKYDLIISNPPFYENDLLSDDEQRNLALHSTKLDLVQLLKLSKTLISENGQVAILIPFRRMEYFEEEIKKSDFFINRKVKVKQTPTHNWFRCMYILKLSGPDEFPESEIIIKSQDKYTEEFYSVVQDYYL